MGIVTEIILPLALAFIMFALGLGLTFADFARVAKMPRDFAVGVASQLILLPLTALLLISLWDLPAELALGVMVIAAAPGGVTSNILTSFAKGDVALSISLTAIISLVSVISIPIIIGFSYTLLIDGNDQDININKIAISVFLIVTIPVCIGLAFRQFASDFWLRFEPWAKKISAILVNQNAGNRVYLLDSDSDSDSIFKTEWIKSYNNITTNTIKYSHLIWILEVRSSRKIQKKYYRSKKLVINVFSEKDILFLKSDKYLLRLLKKNKVHFLVENNMIKNMLIELNQKENSVYIAKKLRNFKTTAPMITKLLAK